MKKLPDEYLDWNEPPTNSDAIEKALFNTAHNLQKLLETKLYMEETFKDNPIAEKIRPLLDIQIEVLERDLEIVKRVASMQELLEDVRKMPSCELPPIPVKTKKTRKARKPKTPNENIS